MDLLSDALSVLDPRSAGSFGLVTGGDWAVQFPARHQGLKFGAALKGGCWIRVEGSDTAERLEAGDCFLLTDGRSYWMGSDPALVGVDAANLFARAERGTARLGECDEVRLLAGRFTFDAENAALLLGGLPPLVRVPGAAREAGVVQWTLEQLSTEMRDGQIGHGLMAGHLAQILLLQIFRALASTHDGDAGWLAGLRDARVGAALRAMHSEPARRWTLAELSSEAGMSRTAFALRFKTLLGETPLAYLSAWRMRLAARALSAEAKPVTSIAFSLGYLSDSAFSAAFKRHTGRSPQRFRRARDVA